MPVVPYCLLLRGSKILLPAKGIRGSPIQTLSQNGLLALYSEMEKSVIDRHTFGQAAIEFHNVVHAIFGHVAVVPFRFPTWLAPGELAVHLEKESRRYETFLSQHADHVQMELRLTLPSSGRSRGAASSGTDHLRERATEFRRLRETSENLKHLLSTEVIEWREREIPEGARLYALVARSQLAGFRERLGMREHQISVHLSGPWPATEFLPATAEPSTEIPRHEEAQPRD